jgi:hypothetical protein
MKNNNQQYSPLNRSISATFVPNNGKSPVACQIKGLAFKNGKLKIVIESSLGRYANPDEICCNL